MPPCLGRVTIEVYAAGCRYLDIIYESLDEQVVDELEGCCIGIEGAPVVTLDGILKRRELVLDVLQVLCGRVRGTLYADGKLVDK